MSVPIPISSNNVCCYLDRNNHGGDCENPAEWIIRHGEDACEYTISCTEHVGPMLTDAVEHRIYPITESPLTGSYNQWDLPHHAEVSRGAPKKRKRLSGPNLG